MTVYQLQVSWLQYSTTLQEIDIFLISHNTTLHMSKSIVFSSDILCFDKISSMPLWFMWPSQQCHSLVMHHALFHLIPMSCTNYQSSKHYPTPSFIMLLSTWNPIKKLNNHNHQTILQRLGFSLAHTFLIDNTMSKSPTPTTSNVYWWAKYTILTYYRT